MKRVVTAIALIAFAIYLIFFSPDWGFGIGALCLGLLCYWEYAGLVAAHSIPRPGVFGALGGLLILFWPEFAWQGIVLLVLLAFIVALRLENMRDILSTVACALLGSFYAFAPWRFAVDLRAESVHLLFFALALTWIGDTAAYYGGRAFGRHRLAPIVSPKKTWEGAGASVAASVIFGLLYLGHFMARLPWWQVALMAIVGNVAGQFGDLAESSIKRGAGVKDSGTLLPGHGGILDRVDSSLFALPAVYLLFTAFVYFSVL